MSFYRESIIKKTRKVHQCGFCGRLIPAGMPAVETAGTNDGDFFNGHLCLPCRRDMNDVDLTDGYDLFDYFEHDEFIKECPECKEDCGTGSINKNDSAYLDFECGHCGHEFQIKRGWE